MAEEKEEKPRFNPDQYAMLKRCAQKKDFSQWNEWRDSNSEQIELEDAELSHLDLFNIES